MDINSQKKICTVYCHPIYGMYSSIIIWGPVIGKRPRSVANRFFISETLELPSQSLTNSYLFGLWVNRSNYKSL